MAHSILEHPRYESGQFLACLYLDCIHQENIDTSLCGVKSQLPEISNNKLVVSSGSNWGESGLL